MHMSRALTGLESRRAGANLASTAKRGGRRSCFSKMNPVRKRLRLSPSKPPPSNSSPLKLLELLSNDAPPASAGARTEDGEEEEEYLLVEEDTTDSSLVITMEDSQMEVKAPRKKAARKKRKGPNEEPTHGRVKASETEEEEDAGVEVEIDKQLDQSLETKSKQHNLTAVNVKNIIHEVITNEHVVAMMKAAINETEAVPPFEPKMTRSKFKEVVEKGVVIPTWNISPIKKSSDANKAPQFVDIPLDEEDSSDEEYRPDEEEEDETAEDTFQESDMESTASSPRGSRLNRGEEDSCSPWQSSRVQFRRSKLGSMGPPPPPKAPPPKAVTDSTFLEKLHAVEEELADCMEPYQPLSESEDEAGVMACRTRSKRPLRDVPLGQLEAKLRAPDITPDMYDSSSAPEDRDWTDWLRSLMSSDLDNEDECDDEDDPEYNFLADTDEPDVEDYRDDKAVRITKKEVNELMEELFETLKEDLASQEVEDEGHEEEEEPQEDTQTVQPHPPPDLHIEAVKAEPEDDWTPGLRTVKQQLAFIRKREQTNAHYQKHSHCPEPCTLKLNAQQKRRLQQQLQQHVQLLTQIHLLCLPVVKLHGEAETTKQFLFELDMLAQGGELIRSAGQPGFCSAFRASNLQGALELLEELHQTPISYEPQHHPPDARGYMRCFPVMPAELAWLFATRPVFLYPELLPCASLDPALYCPRRTAAFTAAEDCLLVLGLRNLGGSCDPPKLVSHFLVRKTVVQVRRRILQCCRPGFPDNIVKAFRYQQVLWPMPVACRPVDPAERRPPVEREDNALPLWLVRSLPIIYLAVKHSNSPSGSIPEAPPSCRKGKPRQSQLAVLRSASITYSFPPGSKYPPRLPANLDFKRMGFVLVQPPPPPPASNSCPPLDTLTSTAVSSPSPPRVLLHRLPLHKTDTFTSSTVSTVTTEKIRGHIQTLAGLRRRLSPSWRGKPSLEARKGSASFKKKSINVLRTNLEGGVKERKMSESSPSSRGSLDSPRPKGAEPEREHEVTVTLSRSGKEEETCGDGETSSDESRSSVVHVQEKLSSEETEDDDDLRESEDVVFAQDYLHRVCEAVQGCPSLAEQLLQVLDEFSAAGAPDVLYGRLSHVLQPWPQLLKDFAGFLNHKQARKCGLLLEQQLFKRSRQFLRRLGRTLGESSSLYQEVVSVLQGCSAPSSEDMDKVASLLRHHADLQVEVREFFQQLHTSSGSTTGAVDSQNNSGGDGTEGDREEQRAVCAKNSKLTSTGEKVVVWTREADRTILTACQQKGANRKTFRHISAQLGNKTVHQVQLRFQDLMKLFYTASSKGQPVNKPKAAPD
ncbi:GON-4-like protein isoform X1 [Oryzias melastigma]|nr:GON-4-like protein isoform X1 [Oryzias melastigma]